jgi:hypothetical protein
MFEKSLEENPYYLIPGMRNEGPGISMPDIGKATPITDLRDDSRIKGE